MLSFNQFLESRIKGKSLPETGYKWKYVHIYRATNTMTFKPMDYITLSLKFAKEHAEHQESVQGEPYWVITAMVEANKVFEAYNPGEYFWGGEEIRGKKI